MFRIRKEFKFEAAHRLASAYTKQCVETVHGHSYKVEVFLTAESLNDDDMVVDFGAVKEACSEVIKAYDHALVLSHQMAAQYMEAGEKKVVSMPGNPTAEIMAVTIYRALQKQFVDLNSLSPFPRLEYVRVWETETSWAEFWL